MNVNAYTNKIQMKNNITVSDKKERKFTAKKILEKTQETPTFLNLSLPSDEVFFLKKSKLNANIF